MNDHSLNEDALPLVSFLIVTYNQVAYVDAAVEGAQAQDYSNLEIVITDDGSTDGTWERLNALAEKNPALTVRQTPKNMGTLGNLYHGVEYTSGALLVLAAGDDVSKPNRVSRLAKEWQDTGADALQSAYSVINDHDQKVTDYGMPISDPSFQDCFQDRRVSRIVGATSAYTRRVFQELACPEERVLAEDIFFGLFLNIYERKIVTILEPLVYYRQHSQSSTNTGGGMVTDAAEIRQLEGRAQIVAASMSLCFTEALNAVDERRFAFGRRPSTGIDRKFLMQNAAHYAFASNWLHSKLAARWKAFLHAGDRDKRRWALARLFGVRGIALARRLKGRGRS